MAVCGKCGRKGTVREIRACAFEGKPHGGEAMPKMKWGDGITAEAIDGAPEGGGSRYEGELPPAGVYTWSMESCKAEVASTGSDMLAIRWAITDATGDKKEFNGAPWWDNLVVGKSTLWKVKQFCRAVGITFEDFTDRIVLDEDKNVLKFGSTKAEGIKIKASVKRSPGNDGNMRLEFAQYFPKHNEDSGADAKKPKKGKAKDEAPEPAEDSKPKKGKKKDKEAPPF